MFGNKRFFTAFNFTLSALLALTCIMLARDIITFGVQGGGEHPRGVAVSRAFKNPRVPLPPGALKGRPALSDYSAVAEKNVFGFPPMNVTPLTAQSGQAASSMSLIGTVSGAWSYAIFLADSGRQLLYRAGQTIPGLGCLKSINKDWAIVRTPAGDVKLPLKDIATIEPASGQAAGPRAASRAAAGPASHWNHVIASAGRDSYLLNKNAVQNVIQNPTRILSDARLLPNIVNGRQEGFKVSEVKPGGFFSTLGLMNGDVLLKVNNNEISGPDMALRAFTALQGLDRVNLDIIRGGRRTTLVYQIR
ncbi:MAG: hypothetical protein M0Z58_05875 [Nitrospiraceae bacterium]|nr:hypothetical protein [Nitrospiraceae bacterium]